MHLMHHNHCQITITWLQERYMYMYMNCVSRTTMVYLFNILTVYRIDASFSESRGR